MKQELEKYEILLRVYNPSPDSPRLDHSWTMTFMAESFGEAEEKALEQLRKNNDKDSEIHRIELW